MTLEAAVLTFAVVAAVLTVTPGLDTALVLRAALTRSRREAAATSAGIVAGLFVWGAAAAAGISALLIASEVAYDVLRYAGAAYLVWFGVRLLVRALGGAAETAPATGAVPTSVWRAARTGLAANLLNPKVGVFYVALLPQFLPSGSDPLLVGLLLAGVHAVLSIVWFTLLISLATLAGRWLRRPATVRAIDAVTGVMLVGFGARLALSGRG
ncbi:threonine/homoserine/homoserine lactone efflux protein [Blastococcus colisei]|uniref:Threonine/homoserine/homoserine lactone efflux protein n=1 Tax=Blastococcus colisei TaxID=1564162 RepID=A0A543PGM4_9ACTN|nr:LysE family translocator [Blastococcus colisei]TQN43227.1 threonine/homoserine/homoserine lactone efflux protein [Blastococcus colisei]